MSHHKQQRDFPLGQLLKQPPVLAECQSVAERQAHFAETVLALYRKLPDTPNRHSRYDRRLALQLCQQKVPLTVIENALLLTTAPPSARSFSATSQSHSLTPLLSPGHRRTARPTPTTSLP